VCERRKSLRQFSSPKVTPSVVEPAQQYPAMKFITLAQSMILDQMKKSYPGAGGWLIVKEYEAYPERKRKSDRAFYLGLSVIFFGLFSVRIVSTLLGYSLKSQALCRALARQAITTKT
jgi:hypothetical protein